MKSIFVAFAMAIVGPALLLTSGCQTTSNQAKTETERFNAWADKVFDAAVDKNPEWQTRLGIKKDYDKLADYSDEFAKRDLESTKVELEAMKQFDFTKLEPQAQITYTLMKRAMEREVREFKWRFHSYPVNQMFGRHSGLPAFLINMHRIDSESDAKAYISRVKATRLNFAQLLDKLKTSENKGVIPPKFVFPKVSENMETLLKGKPFDSSGKDSSLLADFKSKVNKLKLSASTKKRLVSDLESALLSHLKPAYDGLLTYWTKLEKKADTKAGVWKLPEGDEFYKTKLAYWTTTDMTAEEIHSLGLKEVARIQKEMNQIKRKVGFKGSLKAFFKHVQNNEKLFYEESKAGKQQYLTDTQTIIDNMTAKLPTVFGILPKAKLKLKAVEPFREKSSGKAFYTGPAPDGSRPGIYYVNLLSMKEQPKYEMEALAYHEAIPGHHMQSAITKELKGLPKFRTFGAFYGAYIEGWGLYSELVPKEMGFYTDPYSDFGRLTMENWRAIRLVVDTGLHHKRWTREKAIAYTKRNSPADPAEAVRSIERYIVMPGQATSYKVGMLKILELRKKARASLGKAFKMADFHDQILKNGPLPLDVLESQIDKWIASNGASHGLTSQ